MAVKVIEETTCVEHERTRFISYPAEWRQEMLYTAAELTLDTALRLAPFVLVTFGQSIWEICTLKEPPVTQLI